MGVFIIKFYYDLHIHTCLSPCGDVDMTPCNIVNMSLIKGLDIIAITDHNTCKNVESVIKAADNRITVIPGIEVETSEEVHVVCYFKKLEDAIKLEEIIDKNMNKIINKPEIYGEQVLMDEEDNVTGKLDNLLIISTNIDFYSLFKIVNEIGGIAVPAHIDRSSYSVISNMGFMPPDIDIPTIEITPKNRLEWEKKYNKYNIISDSDAHYLENIAEPEYFMNIIDKNIENIFDFLCKK